jgi:cell division protein FtsW (lipid II flippase)
MLIFTVTLLVVFAVITVYCTRKQQRFLKKPIKKQWRLLSIALIVCALILALQQYSVTAAVFYIIFSLMLMLMLIPFISLLKRKG